MAPPFLSRFSRLFKNTPSVVCPTCGKSVPLETAKTDSDGKAVHEHWLHARIGCFLSTEVWSENADQKVLAFITNLSVGGCYVTTNSPLPVETKVRIALWLDDQAKTWTDGMVISSHRDVGMGIKFLGLSLHNQEAVERCIEAQKDSRLFANSFTTAFPTQQK